MKNVLSLFILIVLSACGSGRTMVLEKNGKAYHVSNLEIQEIRSDLELDEDSQESFQKAQASFNKMLSEKLYQDLKFAQGSDLKVEYKFVQFDEGSQFARYMFGGLGNAGEGELTIEVCFKDKQGIVLSKIHAGGKIGSGFFGGSFDSAIEKAAEQVQTYVKRNYA